LTMITTMLIAMTMRTTINMATVMNMAPAAQRPVTTATALARVLETLLHLHLGVPRADAHLKR
jgi:hypothetical protein